MKLLAVDTATDACSAALYLDGEIVELYQRTQRDHSRLILPMIDRLLAEAGLKPVDLEGLAFGRGPGSFTGVRIATGVIHGIALGTGLPVVPVSTLAAIAEDYFTHSRDELDRYAYVALDARMGEIYWGVYGPSKTVGVELIGAETVTPADAIPECDVPGVGLGSGWAVYRPVLLARLPSVSALEVERWPRASAIARLGVLGFAQGLAVDVELAQPVYLRDKVANKESER